MDGIRFIRWALIGLGILGGVLALFADRCFPIAAHVWPRAWLVGIFLLIPVLLIILGLRLRVSCTASRKGTIIGLWLIYALGIVGGAVFFLYTALAATVMDLSWDPSLKSSFSTDWTAFLCLAISHIVVMFLITMAIARYLGEDETIMRFQQQSEQPLD